MLAIVLAACRTTPVEAPRTGAETRIVASRDGVPIAYDVRGAGDVALVFVHCWACNRAFWREQADAFAARYRVVTLDLAGHGMSGKDRPRWSILGLADDVIAVADALGLSRIVLVGHSMGGPVALEVARRLRGRVLGVVLVDTLHDATARRTEAAARADADRLQADFAGYFADLSALFARGSDPAVRHWVERQAQAANHAAAIALKLDTPNVDGAALLRGAGVPIRAINAMPPLSDPTAAAANQRLADYQVTLVDGAGHFLPLEQPARFNAELQRWLSSLTERVVPAGGGPGPS